MTTLPQTSPMRLPRPMSPSHLAAPVAAAAAAIAPPTQGTMNPMTGSDVWRVLRANFWLIVVVVVGAMAAGVVINMWLAAKHPRFTATGLIRVSVEEEAPTFGQIRVSSGASSQNIEIEQHDQAQRLKQPSLLVKVLAKSKIRETQWFREFVTIERGQPVEDLAAAKEDLQDKLLVSPVPNSRLVQVSMSYTAPRDCATIVEEVVNEFLQEVRGNRTNNELLKTQTLEQLRQTYSNELNEKVARIRRIAEQMGEKGLTLNGPGSKDYELQALIGQQVHIQEEYNKVQSELRSFDEQLKNGGTPAIVEDMIQRNPAYVEDRRFTDDAEMSQRLLENQLGKTHNLVVRARTMYEGWQEKLNAVHEEVKTQAIASLKMQIASAAESSRASMEGLGKRIDELRSDIAQLAKTRNEYENLLADQKVLSDQLVKVKQDQDAIAVFAPGSNFSTAVWHSMPEVPDRPSFPKLPITLAAALVVGLAVSLGIAFLREMTDTTVRSPRDIARVGQINLLGMIPHESDDPQTAGARLPLAIFEAPHSIIAEQFRQVRTRLQHAASLDTTRSILVTGCGPGDGKSTVACNLAAGLALNGRKILLVDVNFRRPELHNIFNVGNDVGFGDVLNAPELYEEAIRETEVPNLSVLTSGNKPSNPTELLESQLLIDFIERALEEFDHVIFDSGPLLIVSETIALAPRVDGVITVVRAHGNSRGLLQRLRDQLRQLKAEHLGVILNAVRVQGGGYYGPMIKTYYAYGNGNGNGGAVVAPIQ